MLNVLQECAKWIREYGKYPDPWYKLKFKPKEPKPEKKPKEKKEKKEKMKKEPKMKVSLDKLCRAPAAPPISISNWHKCSFSSPERIFGHELSLRSTIRARLPTFPIKSSSR